MIAGRGLTIASKKPKPKKTGCIEAMPLVRKKTSKNIHARNIFSSFFTFYAVFNIYSKKN
jgi:hypothetical protein